MSIAENFRQTVEAALAADEDLHPTQLGKEALGDPNFVFQLRKGRSCSARTMDRVLAYLDKRQRAASDEEAA